MLFYYILYVLAILNVAIRYGFLYLNFLISFF